MDVVYRDGFLTDPRSACPLFSTTHLPVTENIPLNYKLKNSTTYIELYLVHGHLKRVSTGNNLANRTGEYFSWA